MSAPTVACYTFPHYHRSAYNDRRFAPGWTEYQVARGARPWFPGHHQPRTPLLGELDERDPATWETYVDLAAGAGIGAFIWDWYWYDGAPAFHEALEEGFLRARGRDRVAFAVMWTNHPWVRVFPTTGGSPSPAARHWDLAAPPDVGAREFLSAPPQSPEDVWRSLSYVVARYLHDPWYWRLEGRPVLVIWDAGQLVDVMGTPGTASFVAELQAFARRLGHPALHLHAAVPSPGHDLAALGVSSYGEYNLISRAVSRRPDEEELPRYDDLVDDVTRNLWPELDALSPLPCFPSISPGWDNTPRTLEPVRGEVPSRARWPWTAVAVEESPAAFEALTRAAVAYLEARPGTPPVITVGCWNEWTEGQYLLPDTRLGYGMLRALARGLSAGREGRGGPAT